MSRFCDEKILKNLARTLKRPRKSLVGEEAQKWARPQLWAWTHECGYAHFACPSPRDLGVHSRIRNVGQPAPRDHANGTHPHISTSAHEKLATHGRPRNPTHPGKFRRPRHLHAAPRLPTKGWRPRSLWASAHTDAPPRTLREPT